MVSQQVLSVFLGPWSLNTRTLFKLLLVSSKQGQPEFFRIWKGGHKIPDVMRFLASTRFRFSFVTGSPIIRLLNLMA